MADLIGGDKLEEYLRKIEKSLETPELSVGFLSGATYPDGQSVAEVAFWNEFGHGGRFPAPARPFFRPMVSQESPTWGKKLGKALAYYEYDGVKALKSLGEDIAGALAQSIVDTNEPELSPTTLMLRKKFGNNPQEIRARDVLAAQQDVAAGKEGASGTQAKPLVWTGHMKNSIDFKVGE